MSSVDGSEPEKRDAAPAKDDADRQTRTRVSRWDQRTPEEIETPQAAAMRVKAELEAKVRAAAAKNVVTPELLPVSAASVTAALRPEERPEGGVYSVIPGQFGRVFYPPTDAQATATSRQREERRQREHMRQDSTGRIRDPPDDAEQRPRKRRTFTEGD